jgi:hypothetical protein
MARWPSSPSIEQAAMYFEAISAMRWFSSCRSSWSTLRGRR